jgi:hypothetical protein
MSELTGPIRIVRVCTTFVPDCQVKNYGSLPIFIAACGQLNAALRQSFRRERKGCRDLTERAKGYPLVRKGLKAAKRWIRASDALSSKE